jgi:hypothetical protein
MVSLLFVFFLAIDGSELSSRPLKNPRGARGVPLDEVESVRDQGAVAALAG